MLCSVKISLWTVSGRGLFVILRAERENKTLVGKRFAAMRSPSARRPWTVSANLIILVLAWILLGRVDGGLVADVVCREAICFPRSRWRAVAPCFDASRTSFDHLASKDYEMGNWNRIIECGGSVLVGVVGVESGVG
jgi:hypothetical protein